MEDVKENVGWSAGGGAEYSEWQMTLPKDLTIAVVRLNILSLPESFPELNF